MWEINLKNCVKHSDQVWNIVLDSRLLYYFIGEFDSFICLLQFPPDSNNVGMDSVAHYGEIVAAGSSVQFKPDPVCVCGRRERIFNF